MLNLQLNLFANLWTLVVGMTVKAYKKIHVNLRYQYSIVSIRPDERIPVNFGYGNKGQFNNLFNVRVIYLF